MIEWIKEELPLIAAWTLAIGAVVMFFLPIGFNLIYGSPYDFTEYATFVGGTAGPMAALAGFLFIYLTFQHQQDQLTEQKEQFQQQSFESTFFKLLDLYIKERDSISIDHAGFNTLQGKNAFYGIYNYYFRHEIHKLMERNNIEKDDEFPLITCFRYLHKNYEMNLSEYQRAFQLILKFIDDNGRYSYLEFLSALMEENEMVFQAFYNKTFGFILGVDLVQEHGFMINVNPAAFQDVKYYYALFNIFPPEEVDVSDPSVTIIS